MIRRLLLSRHEGNIADILGTSLCLIILLTVLLTTIQYMRILNIKRAVENTGREYLLYLEEQGELKSNQLTDLRTKLTGMGFADSSIEVTYNENNTRKGYAQEVSLQIHINATRHEMGLSPVAGFVRDRYVINCRLCSIAKH